MAMKMQMLAEVEKKNEKTERTLRKQSQSLDLPPDPLAASRSLILSDMRPLEQGLP